MSSVTPQCQKKFDTDVKLLEENPVPNMDAFRDPVLDMSWHFILHCEEDKKSPYSNGDYIGAFTHQNDYRTGPMFEIFTPSGRFGGGCYNIISEWKDGYNVRDILTKFKEFWFTDEATDEDIESIEKRQQYAKESVEFNTKFYTKILENFEERRQLLKEGKKPIDKNTECYLPHIWIPS